MTCTNAADLVGMGIVALFTLTVCVVVVGMWYVLLFKD